MIETPTRSTECCRVMQAPGEFWILRFGVVSGGTASDVTMLMCIHSVLVLAH
jgi:hypothetical protein